MTLDYLPSTFQRFYEVYTDDVEPQVSLILSHTDTMYLWLTRPSLPFSPLALDSCEVLTITSSSTSVLLALDPTYRERWYICVSDPGLFHLS